MGCDSHMDASFRLVWHILSPIETFATVEAMSETRIFEDLPIIICSNFWWIPVLCPIEAQQSETRIFEDLPIIICQQFLHRAVPWTPRLANNWAASAKALIMFCRAASTSPDVAAERTGLEKPWGFMSCIVWE